MYSRVIKIENLTAQCCHLRNNSIDIDTWCCIWNLVVCRRAHFTTGLMLKPKYDSYSGLADVAFPRPLSRFRRRIHIHWGASHEGSGRHPRQHGGGRGRRLRQVYGKFSPCLFVTAAQLLWVDCKCYGTHWRGIPSCRDSVSRRYSGLKFHVATRVSVMSVFPGTRVSVGPAEGTAVYRWTFGQLNTKNCC